MMIEVTRALPTNKTRSAKAFLLARDSVGVKFKGNVDGKSSQKIKDGSGNSTHSKNRFGLCLE